MKNYLKRKLLIYGSFIIILSIITLIYTVLLYYQKINSQNPINNYLTFGLCTICFFIMGLISGYTAEKNGLLEGLISGMVIILIVLIANLFIKRGFQTNNFVKITAYIISSGLGGIIGVNIYSKRNNV